MSSGKWDMVNQYRPLNTVISVLHGGEVKGSFVIENDDTQSLELWTKIKDYLNQEQKDAETITRVN